mgnify:CR=1 FL=1
MSSFYVLQMRFRKRPCFLNVIWNMVMHEQFSNVFKAKAVSVPFCSIPCIMRFLDLFSSFVAHYPSFYLENLHLEHTCAIVDFFVL